MSQATSAEMLLKHNLKVLRLPTMLSEYAQLSHEAAEADEGYEQYLLRLTELEVAQRSANALAARIKAATFPVLKDLDTYDFSAMPSLSKQKILELKPGRVDRAALQCLLHRQCGHGKNALIHCSGSGGLPLRQAGAVLHRSRPG